MIAQFDNLSEFGAAFAHALFDGLWVGAVVAIAVHLLMRGHRNLNAASRHAAWYAALLVIAAMPVVSFAASLAHINVTATPPPAIVSGPFSHSPADVESAAPPSTSIGAIAADSAPASRFGIAALGRVAVYAAVLAAAVALVRIAVLLSGLFALARVKRASRIVPVDVVPSLARAMAGDPHSRAVALRVSEALETPAAAGFRTPAILLPAALMDTIEPDALDQIALHEYAHLRRYDDWTNLFQRFIERVYWFNPAVWFVAGRVDLEREIACDDWAVAGADAVSGYADCLWHLARDGRIPAFAATAPGAFLTRNQIAARIEHLLQHRRDSAPFWRPTKLLAVAPVLAAAVALVIGRAPAIALHVDASPVANAERVATIGTTAVAAPSDTAPALAAVIPVTAVAPHRGAAPQPYCPKPPKTHAIEHVQQEHVHMHLHLHAASHRAVHQVIAERVSLTYTIRQALRVSQATIAQTRVTIAKTVAKTVDAQSSVVAAAAMSDNLTSGPLDRNLLAHCTGCDLSGKDLRNADLHDLTLTGDDLSGADLRGANLKGAILTGVDLSNARLDGADLRGATLTGSDIDGATFSGAKIEGIRLVGMQLTNRLLTGTSARALIGSCTGCDLSGLDLHGRDLHGITLDGADLHGVDLSGANLSGARFNGVDLQGANFDGADLTNAAFNGCDLQNVDFSNARTDGIQLQGSTLGHVKPSGKPPHSA